MNMNNNADSKETLQLNQEYIPKSVKHLRWGFTLEIASDWNPLAISAKKLPLRCLTGTQVRKIGDDTDHKGKSRLN